MYFFLYENIHVPGLKFDTLPRNGNKICYARSLILNCPTYENFISKVYDFVQKLNGNIAEFNNEQASVTHARVENSNWIHLANRRYYVFLYFVYW